MTSPPLIEFSPSQVGMLTLFLTNRTEPSPNMRLLMPPGVSASRAGVGRLVARRPEQGSP